MDQLSNKGASALPSDSPSDRLDSWKEIALFLKRDVSTVQRWEKLEALPVHRHMHGERGTVFAYKSEVTSWWNNRRLKLESQEKVPSQNATTHDKKSDTARQPSRRPLSASAQRAIGAIGLAILIAAVLFFLPKWRPQLAHPSASRLLATIQGDVSAPNGQAMYVSAGDLNGDGIADAVVDMQTNGETGIFFGGKLRATMSISSDADVLIREEHGHQLRLLGMADINGDGLQDLIFYDIPPDPENFAKTGPIVVLFGRSQWKSKINLPSDSDLTISIPVAYNASPVMAVSSGHADLNGDGIDDVVFSANDFSPPGRASAGAVFVFWGRRIWPVKIDTTEADITVWGSTKGEGLYSAAIGDINGDGRNDLVLFAANNSLWNMRENRGRVYAFFGRAEFPRLLDAAKDFDFRIDGTKSGDHLSAVTLGDINGDGLQDIILDDRTDMATKADSVLVFYGRKKWQRDLAFTDSDWQLVAGGSGIRVEGGAFARDFGGSGADDLIVCTTEGADSQFRFFRGGTARHGIYSTDSADMVVRAGTAEDGICIQPSAVADFDGKRVPDLLVAAPQASTAGLSNAGKAFVYAPFTFMQIDIRPGGYPNIVTPGSDGVVAVAILPEDGINPRSVDVGTLRLAGVPPISSNYCHYNPRDQEALCVYFESKNIRLKTSNRTGVLTGKMEDGTPIYGSDSVLVLPLPQSKTK